MSEQTPLVSNRLLVVDDEADFVDNLRDILTDVGFVVDGTTSAEEALYWAATRTYDVAVLDLRMPEIDGLRLHGRLRAAQRDVATVLLTAYADADTMRAAEAAGFWSILEKPCDVPRIRDLLLGLTRRPLLLVVDDEPEFGENLCQILHQHRVRAACSHSVADAMDKLARRRFDVVLLDFVLPDESPTDLVEFVRGAAASGSETPAGEEAGVDIRIVSGHSSIDPKTWKEMEKWGVGPLWRKPLDVKRLVDSLEYRWQMSQVGLDRAERTEVSSETHGSN